MIGATQRVMIGATQRETPVRASSPLNSSLPDVCSATPDLSVIVVTHNRQELALKTLSRARAAADAVAVQWLVIDSGSTDGTPDAIERAWSDVHVERQANIGFAASNNRGLALAGGRYVLLLNPDCVVSHGTFAELLATLDAQQGIGIASVVQRSPEGALQHSIRRFPSLALALAEAVGAARLPLPGCREEENRSAHYARERAAGWLVGAFLVARAEAIAEVGPLDERFFLYSEEVDWCYRFRAAGWDVRHLPVMEVTHWTSASYRPELMAQLSHAKLLFARKHYSARRSRAIRAALILRHRLRATAAGALSVSRPAWRERQRAERTALAVVAGRSEPPFGAGG